MNGRPLLLALALTACGGQAEPEQLPPLGQLKLFIDTDAPIPPAPGTVPDADAAPWLFDRLRIEVLRGRDDDVVLGAIPIAQRDFSLHAGLFDDGPVSIGIVPEPGDEGLTARVRLFRGDRTVDGQPRPNGTVENRLPLPPTSAEGIVELFTFLTVEHVGVPRGSRPETEIPRGSRIGSWAALDTGCAAEPQPGEACVPGGAFWFGDPALRGNVELADADDERLVVVSPFFVDLREVTVGELRSRLGELVAAGHPPPPSWNGTLEGDDVDDYATFTPGPSEADPADSRAALPVSAITWATARAYCQLLGKDLPTEVMFELLASGRGRETLYVWGDDDPRCDDAVLQRAGLGVYANFPGDCRGPLESGGPLPPGSAIRDRIELGGSEVVDLAGNLTEWTLDWLHQQGTGVWATPGLLRDPVATEPEGGLAERVVRGSSWRGDAVQARAAARSGRHPDQDNRSLGFRCARR